jgi:ABC-type bacteriocin/lantibiotic exporter with double-glycine peptidase domain
VSENEWRALFRDKSDFKLSISTGLSFTVFAVMFFFIGVLEGLVLISIGSYWLVLVPLLTGLAALLLVLLWLRTGTRETRSRRPTQAGVHHQRARGMLSQ